MNLQVPRNSPVVVSSLLVRPRSSVLTLLSPHSSFRSLTTRTDLPSPSPHLPHATCPPLTHRHRATPRHTAAAATAVVRRLAAATAGRVAGVTHRLGPLTGRPTSPTSVAATATAAAGRPQRQVPGTWAAAAEGRAQMAAASGASRENGHGRRRSGRRVCRCQPSETQADVAN